MTFTQKPAFTTSSSAAAFDVVVHPTKSDIWVSSSAGLHHSTDSGNTWTSISAASRGYHLSLGMPKTVGGYPAVFLVGVVDGIQGVYKSDNGC